MTLRYERFNEEVGFEPASVPRRPVTADDLLGLLGGREPAPLHEEGRGVSDLHEIKLVIDSGDFLLTITPRGKFRVWRVNEDNSLFIEGYGEAHAPRLPGLTALFRALNEFWDDGHTDGLREFGG